MLYAGVGIVKLVQNCSFHWHLIVGSFLYTHKGSKSIAVWHGVKYVCICTFHLNKEWALSLSQRGGIGREQI